MAPILTGMLRGDDPVAQYSKQNGLLKVTTPKGSVMQQKTKSGKVKISVEWDPSFGPDWTEKLNSVQAMFDQEVLRVTEPYVPMDTGLLRRSATLASNIGAGELVYATPYASAQYYDTANSRPYSSKAGGHWGDRMKADNLSHLASFARKAVQKSDK